ncbi:TonB-dependent receptor [Flammeovirga sp. SJP92]|uniref:SusC/RagA family TonB-linked outer membrane protein n=1 Tax=Flammeovirga sp. SJP92 TaxID=1775430 RepID=UPI000787425E|nr:TonB-dependent receptor [Flammeovirga sp. SJP92]KXX67733.1 hypothetical protein AVL50_25025 [Flammeovirga sp. SJP92]
MYKRLLSSIVFILALAVNTFAQEKTVSGVVTEEGTGQPLPGVTVVIKGTSKGTITNIDGAFKLQQQSASDVLVFSFVGYEAQEVAVGTQSTVNVTLNQDLEQLEEVVVIGYGTTEKTSFTGAATTVDSGTITKVQTSNPLSSLEGSVPGLSVTGISGQPGSSPDIVVRGFAGIGTSNAPLIVVDGAIFDGQMNAINPNDIESFSVLKDASGTAIYGSRATNGIIMITTKSGKTGAPKINFSTRYGVSERAFKEYERVGSKDYMSAMYEGLKQQYMNREDNPLSAEEAGLEASKNLMGTTGNYNNFKISNGQPLINEFGEFNETAQMLWEDDWQGELIGTGIRQEYNLDVNGASDKTDYLLSLGYLDEEGIVKNSGFEKFTARLKVNTDIKKWVKAGLNVNYGYTTSNFLGADGTATSNPFYSTRAMGPIYPVYIRDRQGNFVYDDNGNKIFDFGNGEQININTDLNPGDEGYESLVRPYAGNSNVVATTQLDQNYNERHSIGARGYLDFDFGKGFGFKTNISTDTYATNYLEHQNSEYGDAQNVAGRTVRTNDMNMSYTFNQILTYQKGFDKHNVNAVLGHEYYSLNYQYLSATKTGFPLSGLTELNPATTISGASSYQLDHRMDSYFGRLEYNFDQKYFFSASLRQDATSRFNKDSRVGNFWSVGGAWRLSEESFLKSTSWIDELKLRASYGKLGNEQVVDSNGDDDYYPWEALYNLSFSNSSYPGGKLSSLANPSLEWEKNAMFNIGVDFSFMNKISGAIEVYQSTTEDGIMSKPLAPSTGFSSIIANIGQVQNRGVEITLNATPVRTKNFGWDIGLLWSKNINEITELPQGEFINGTKQWKVGNSIYDFYLREFAGVDPQNGDALYYKDVIGDDGEPTGERETTNVYSEAGRYIVGTAIPDFQGSITNTFTYKGFDFSVLFTYSVGGSVYDGSYATLNRVRAGSALHVDAVHKAWKQPGDVTDVPRLQLDENANLYRTSTRFLTDATNFGIRNLTLGYTLPRSIANKIQTSNVRAYVTADNLWYSNARQGLFINPASSGLTDYTYVPVRTISFGLNLSL